MRLLRWFFAALQSFLVSRSTPENFPDFPFIFAFYFLSAELQNAIAERRVDIAVWAL